jgi:DNA-binding NarL/FixJ family response regulator
VKSEDDLKQKLKGNGEEKPSLIIFDLNNANAKPLTLIPRLKSKLKKGTSIIGFLSHVQGDLKQKAHDVGCDMVLPRSAFSQNLPNLLRRHGASEELTN